MLELSNHESLVADDALDQISDRDDAEELPTFHHRQMAHPFFGHDGHAFLDTLVGPYSDDILFHNVSNRDGRGRLALEGDVARIVPFGDDADDLERTLTPRADVLRSFSCRYQTSVELYREHEANKLEEVLARMRDLRMTRNTYTEAVARCPTGSSCCVRADAS
jgi:hypothetical protein